MLFFVLFLCTVGTSAIFQQQDNLWSCGGETQRNHLFIGKDMIGPTERQNTPHNTKTRLSYWMSSHIGRGMFTSWRGHRSHLPGEDGGKDWRSPSLCHVSSTLLFHGKCTLSIKITYTNFFLLPADINLQTKRRGKHWRGETSASCTTLERLHTVLLVRDETHLYVK